MHAAITVVMLAAFTGCVVHHHVVVDGSELRRTAPLLRAYGHATVDADDERILGDDDSGQHVGVRETLRLDQTLVVDGTPRRIAELVTLCDPNAGPCPLSSFEGFPLTLRRYDTHSIGKALGGAAIVTVIAAAVGAAACTLACADGSPKLASEITLGVVGAGVLGLVGWIVIDCYLLSGGCHD